MGYNLTAVFLAKKGKFWLIKVATMYPSTRRSPASGIESPGVVPMPDPGGLLSSLEAVRREIREIGEEDVDAVLQLITGSALSLTGASGAALAFLTDDEMICRARAGEPAPPLGAPVDVQQGLSGECVRTGLLVQCRDMENDPRIDPEIGRRLGIGSLIAVPIVSDVRVVGLLEIFSPRLRGFTKDHETVLDRLAEMIPKTLSEKPQPGNDQPEKTQPLASMSDSIESGSPELISIKATHDALGEQKPEVAEPVSEQVSEPVSEQVAQQVPSHDVSEQVLDQLPEPAPTAPSNWLHWVLLNWALLGLVSAGVSMALGYLVGSLVKTH
ncbi:MAG: GAF domain-containing protein [Terriglobales bacterium]